MDPKIFNIKHIKKCTQKYKKMQKTHRNCKNHTKNAKNDISGITDILPGFSPYWLSPITSFHHIGDNRYYRDILESVTILNFQGHSQAQRKDFDEQGYRQYSHIVRVSSTLEASRDCLRIREQYAYPLACTSHLHPWGQGPCQREN